MDEKLVSLFERVSQVLRVLLWNTAKERGLSPIQVQFLLYIKGHHNRWCRTSSLAREFDLTQATVSDALGSLIEKKLLCKKTSKKDGRISTLVLTAAGRRLTGKLIHWPDRLKEGLGRLSKEEKSHAVMFLMDIIKHMQNGGIIQSAKMCLLCSHFVQDAHPAGKKPHYCSLTNTPLAVVDLNIDCAMHEAVIQ